MADIYKNFKELSDQEELGKSYIIDCRLTQSGIAVIAPHGGKIESPTSQLAKAVAGDEFSFYSFEGILDSGNKRLHITSENFDEPKILDIVSNSQVVVALHGRRDEYEDEPIDPETIWLGGLDINLIEAIQICLSSSDFKNTSEQKYLRGKKQRNICNRGASRAGAQLEIPASLRTTLQHDSKRSIAFVEAIRTAIRRRIEHVS